MTGSSGPVIVFNIERASASDLVAHDRHELERTSETSEIDPARTHLNRVLCGPPSPKAAVEGYRERYALEKASRRQEEPYVRIVLSASPAYFRPEEPAAGGTWDDARLEAWATASLAWITGTFGEDAVHTALHLDETTPHIHAFVVPTHRRRPRKPARRLASRGETPDEFEKRLSAALAHPGTRVMSYSSHPLFGRRSCHGLLRRTYHAAVAKLDLGYGRDAAAILEAGGVPASPTGARQFLAAAVTRVHAKEALLAEQVADLKRQQDDLDKKRGEMDAEREILISDQAASHSERADLDRLRITLRESHRKRKALLREAAGILAQQQSDIEKAEMRIKTLAARLKGVAMEIGILIGVDVRDLSDALEEIESGLREHRSMLDQQETSDDNQPSGRR